MTEDNQAALAEPSCLCVIQHKPSDATTSMAECPAHGEPDDLAPLPGQGLKYAVIYQQGDGLAEGSHGLVGPLTTADNIELAKFLLVQLGFSPRGVLPMSAFADLIHLAESKGAGQEPTMPPPVAKKLPRGLFPTQAHLPGCVFIPQDHPGDCYVMPGRPL